MVPRWRKVFRDLSSHRFRTALVVLSIAIGVFAVGVVLGTRQVILREFDADRTASAPPDATIRAADFDDELASRVSGAPGIASIQPRRSVSVRYRWQGRDQDRVLSLEALPDFRDIEVGKIVPLEGAPWPPADGEIVLEAAALQVDDYAVGDVLAVEMSDDRFVDLRVAGFAHDINAIPAQFAGFETGYVTFDTMENLGQPALYNQLSLAYEESRLTWAEASGVAGDVREGVFEAAGVRVLHTDVPEPGSHFLGDIFAALSLLLLSLGVLALGLSAFLVVNTVSAIMAQQVRQVGIMKAVGGSASQLEALYAVMVLAYGVLGVAVGLPAAAAGSRWFIGYAAEVLNFRVTDYSVPGWVVAIEAALGVLVPLLAAAGPVRRGVRQSVASALSATGMSGTSFGKDRLDRLLGSVRGLPRPVALALRSTFLRKGRLALTLSTLALASAVVISVFSVQASIGRTISDLEDWWRYDVQLSFEAPQDADVVEEAVAAAPDVDAVDSWHVFPAALVRDDGTRNESFGIVGLDSETDLVGPNLVEGRWIEPGDADVIVVNTDALNREPSMRLGSSITLEVLGQRREWRVVGVIKGQLGGPTAYCTTSAFVDAVGADPGITRVVVRGDQNVAGTEQALLDAVETRLREAGHSVSSTRTREGLTSQVREQLGILVAFLVIMAGLLASVGVIGLTGSMTINVLESTREIGVMRATGAQHRSIYQIFVTEGVTVGALAWLAGALLSYPLSLGLVALLEMAIGFPLSYAFSWGGMAAWLVLMLAISAVASIAPAFRASQVSVRDAIAYE